MAILVRNPEAGDNDPWSVCYIGMIDFPAVVLWVIKRTKLAAAVGVGAGPVAHAGLVTGAVSIAMLVSPLLGGNANAAGTVISDRGMGKYSQTAANALENDFYKVILVLFTEVTYVDANKLILGAFILMHELLALLFRELTVLDFLKTATEASKDSASPSSIMLKEVISGLASHNTHQTYVVDGKSSIFGVVTMRDIREFSPSYCISTGQS
ncbi:unnamed protein product [Calypogeia fissa]